MTKKRKYEATKTSMEVREFAAAVFPDLEELGITGVQWRGICARHGYNISKRTFLRHKSAVENQLPVLSMEKNAGGRSILDEHQRTVCAGWVLARLRARERVTLKTYQAFVKSAFGVEVSLQSVSVWLHEDGFSRRKERSKSPGYDLDTSALHRVL